MTVTGPYVLCPGEEGLLTAAIDFDPTDIGSLEWTLYGNTISVMDNLSPDSYHLPIFEPGLYIITLTTANGCTSVSEFFVEPGIAPQATISGPDCFFPGDTAALTATGDFEFIVWDNGQAGTSIAVTEPGTYCASVYSDSLSNCIGYECFTLNFSNQPELIASDAFCEDSLSNCQQVCAHSLATYEVQGIYDPNSQLVWTISGAESYTINGTVATVQWGDAGQGLVSVADQSATALPIYVISGISMQTNNPGGTLTYLLHLDVFGGIPPFVVQVGTSASGPWTVLNPPYAYQVQPGNTYFYQVIDASGNVVTGSYYVNPLSTCPPIYADVNMQYDFSNDTYTYTLMASGEGIDCSTFTVSGDLILSGLAFETEYGPFGPFPCNQPLSLVFSDDCSNCSPFVLETGSFCPNAPCAGSDELCVSILPEPGAAFTSSPAAVNDTITLCAQQTVSFENNSSGASTYVWNFGDGQVSASFQPEHTYFNPGFYELSLIARNSCYCSDTSKLIVHVLDAIIPDISCLGTVCEGMEVTYSTAANCATYLWNVSPEGSITEGGNPGDNFVTILWNQGPEGYVELSTPGCGASCALPNREYIPIISDDAQIQGNTEVCFESVEEYSITEFGGGTSFNWYVSGGGTILDGQGTHRITVLWEDQADIAGNPQWVAVDFDNCYLECGGQDTLDVFILPEFFIEGPIDVCENSTETFSTHNTINGGGLSAHWQLLDESGNVQWASASATATANIPFNLPEGNYTLLAQAANPAEVCLDEYRIFIRLEAAPPALLNIAGPLEICPGTPYLYQAGGQLPGHNVHWNINDGGTSIEATGNPLLLSWGNSQPYQLSAFQTGSSALQCPSDPIQISPQLIQPFSISGPTDICTEEIATFSIPAFENLSPLWNISNEETALLLSGQGTEEISVQGLQSGTVTISVSVCGLSANMTLNLLAPPVPQPQAPASLCTGETAQVQTTQAYSAYNWYAEDGSLLSTSPTPDLGPGTYLVEVSDNFGCTGEATFSIAENPLPYALISVPLYRGLCTGNSVELYALQSEVGYAYQWFFNGAPIPAATAATFTATQTGLYGLEVTSAAGCTATAPDIQLEACEDVGGVCVNGICMPPGIPGVPGGGCTINELPSYTKSGTADCFTHQFQNTTITHEPGSMTWYFYDANSQFMSISTDENPLITFPPVAGFYPIVQAANMPNLSAPGSYCLVGVLSQDTIKIVPDFRFEPACIGSPTSFTALSQLLADAMPAGYFWDFGDPASGASNNSTQQNPTHVYTAAGDYDVSLTITESSGCEVSVTKTITVASPPPVDFALPAIDCEDIALPFVPAGLNDEVSAFLWDFDDPASGSNNSSDFEQPFHNFSQPGIYDVSLTVTDIAGCSNTQTHSLEIFENQLSGSIAIQPDSLLCPGDTAFLTAPGDPLLVSYAWSNGDSTQTTATQDAGVFGVSLTDNHGCPYSPDDVAIQLFDLPTAVIQAIEYNEYGQPVATFEDSYTACEGEDIYLEIAGSQDYTYVWSTGETGEDISFTEEKDNLLPPGQYDITVIVTNPAGCSAEVGFSITVNPLPEPPLLSILPAPPLCEGETATLSVNGPDPNLSYAWNTGEEGTQIEVIAAGDYFVRATTAEGCSSESEPVSVHTAPPIGQVPSGCFEACNPDTICLPDFAPGTNFQWYFNGAPIPAPEGTAPDLVATENGIYYLNMQDANGCSSTSDPLALDLQDPTGDIGGYVWFDLNESESIDLPDTLVPDINIFLILNGTLIEDDTTDQFGYFLFEDLPPETYLLVIDSTTLPEDWIIVIDSLYVTVEGSCENLAPPGGGPGNPQDSLPGFLLDMEDCLGNTPQTLNFDACENSGITYNGTFINAGESQTFYFTTAAGCDSIVTVNVNALPNSSQTLTFDACEGESISYNGQQIPAGQMQTFTFSNQYGCDSTIIVQVNALPVETESLSFQLCPYDSLLFNGQYLFPGDQMTFTLTNQYGCDSIISVQTLSLPESDFLVEAVDTACWNAPNGSLQISLIEQPVPPYAFSIDGENFQSDSLFQNLPQGAYTIWIEDANGCRFPKEAFLPVIEPLELIVENATIACSEEGVLLEPLLINPSASTVVWQWPDGSGEASWYAEMAGEYSFTVSNVCETLQESIGVAYEADAEGLPVYVPNAFSPNGDGLNDCFKPEFAPEAKIITYTFRVFDRWGNFLFDATGPDDCWNGYFRDRLMDPAVFVWYLEATVQYCHQTVSILKKGDVVMVR